MASNLIPIYRAPDEITANLVKSLLQGEGIPAKLCPLRGALLGQSVLIGLFGEEEYWGYVTVLEEHIEKACELIQAYEPTDVVDEDLAADGGASS